MKLYSLALEGYVNNTSLSINLEYFVSDFNM